MSQDYYDTLGISKNSLPDEIKAAFRRLAMEYHPDRGGDPEKFKKVNEAYQTLSNPEARAQYDKYGSSFEQMRSQGGARGFEGFNEWMNWASAFSNGQNQGNNNFSFDLGDLFGSAFGNGRLGDIFSAFSTGGKSAGRSRAKRGRDLEMTLEISLEEAVHGVNKSIDVEKIGLCQNCGGTGAARGTKIVSCTTCGGSGRVTQTVRSFFGNLETVIACSTCQGEGKRPETACSVCRGKGAAKIQKQLLVKIPAGIENGQTIRLSSEGEETGRGGRSGDFFLNIKVRPHKEFKRQNLDILSIFQLDFKIAVLGGKVQVLTIDGPIEVKIAPGTQSGQILRLKGHGVPSMRHGGRGDHLMEIKIKVPERLSKKQREILEGWED